MINQLRPIPSGKKSLFQFKCLQFDELQAFSNRALPRIDFSYIIQISILVFD